MCRQTATFDEPGTSISSYLSGSNMLYCCTLNINGTEVCKILALDRHFVTIWKQEILLYCESNFVCFSVTKDIYPLLKVILELANSAVCESAVWILFTNITNR